ncbi:hypothetical protein T484DRAFT_1792166, partial [Baffinella frigidus]
SQNQLRTLPPEIGVLSNITDLRLSHNDLEGLPSEVGGLQSLTLLHLAHNRLEALPPEAGFWSALTELNIATNKRFSWEAGFWSALTELNIATNKMTALPVELGLLTILSRLDMANNDISVPPVEVVMRGPADVVDFMRRICDAKYSGILNLSGKSLKLVNPEIFQIEGLRVLNMSDNLLTWIPDTFHTMTLLTELAVSNNQLSTLPPSLASCEGGSLAVCEVLHSEPEHFA